MYADIFLCFYILSNVSQTQSQFPHQNFKFAQKRALTVLRSVVWSHKIAETNRYHWPNIQSIGGIKETFINSKFKKKTRTTYSFKFCPQICNKSKLQALRAQMVEQTNCQVSNIRSITEYEVPFKIQEMLNIVMNFNI